MFDVHPYQIRSPESATDDTGKSREADATRGNDPNKPTFSSFAPVKANDEKASPPPAMIVSTEQFVNLLYRRNAFGRALKAPPFSAFHEQLIANQSCVNSRCAPFSDSQRARAN
jgi:hypothetical protein